MTTRTTKLYRKDKGQGVTFVLVRSHYDGKITSMELTYMYICIVEFGMHNTCFFLTASIMGTFQGVNFCLNVSSLTARSHDIALTLSRPCPI